MTVGKVPLIVAQESVGVGETGLPAEPLLRLLDRHETVFVGGFVDPFIEGAEVEKL